MRSVCSARILPHFVIPAQNKRLVIDIGISFRWKVSLQDTRNPSRVDAKRGDHFRQADFLLPISIATCSSFGPEAFGQDERAEKVVGSNQASATKDVGQEERLHIDRRRPGNLRSHVFEHSSHCSAVIETSEPGGQPDTGPSV